nr:hypothetical protein [Heyndrickxia oleronia]
MKPVISLGEKMDWMKREHRFNLKMIELEHKSRKLDKQLQSVAQKAQKRSQGG